jgi:hypothetical protein
MLQFEYEMGHLQTLSVCEYKQFLGKTMCARPWSMGKKRRRVGVMIVSLDETPKRMVICSSRVPCLDSPPDLSPLRSLLASMWSALVTGLPNSSVLALRSLFVPEFFPRARRSLRHDRAEPCSGGLGLFSVQKSEGGLVSYCSLSVEGIRVARAVVAVVEIDAFPGRTYNGSYCLLALILLGEVMSLSFTLSRLYGLLRHTEATAKYRKDYSAVTSVETTRLCARLSLGSSQATVASTTACPSRTVPCRFHEQ